MLGALGAWLSLALAAGAPTEPAWLTLDVANPEQVGGHRLLSLADVIGPGRRADIPNLPTPRALLAFSVTPEGCVDTGLCAQVARVTEVARARGALVIAVILATKEQTANARAAVRRARHPLVLTFDVHGLVRRAFEFERAGGFVVIDDKGVNIARAQTSKAGDPAQATQTLEQVRTALLSALGPQEEIRP